MRPFFACLSFGLGTMEPSQKDGWSHMMNNLSIGYFASAVLCILACILPSKTWTHLTKQPLREFWIGMGLMALFLLWHSIYPLHDLYVKGLVFLTAVHYFSLSRGQQQWGRTVLFGALLFVVMHSVEALQPWELWFRMPPDVWLALVFSSLVLWRVRKHCVHVLSGALLTAVVIQFILGKCLGMVNTSLQHDMYYTTLFNVYWMSVLIVLLGQIFGSTFIHRNPSQESVDLTKRHS